MSKQSTIPIVIGVTGHRALRPEDRGALYDAVTAELRKLQALCPNSPFVMLNSLAEGADQLCARVALELGIPLVAVLPMAREAYETDFTGEALESFRSLCDRAEQCFVDARPGDPSARGGGRGDCRDLLLV